MVIENTERHALVVLNPNTVEFTPTAECLVNHAVVDAEGDGFPVFHPLWVQTLQNLYWHYLGVVELRQ